MIRRALCEYFVKALMLSPLGYGDNAIKQLLDASALDYPSFSYLLGLREDLDPPVPFKPKDRFHKESMRFLTKEGVYSYFENGPDMRKAKEILEKPRAREFVESMLLSKAPLLAIARRLGDMYKVRDASIKAIELYGHYYFNLDLLDSTETRAILHLKIDRLCESDESEMRMQGKALRKAFYTDPRVSAANLPQSPISALITQLQMGLMPLDVNLDSITKNTELLVTVRLNEAVATGGLEFDRKALNLVTTNKILQELREKKMRPEEELRKELSTLAVKTTETALPLASEVTGGNHTVDLVTVPTSKRKDERPSKK